MLNYLLDAPPENGCNLYQNTGIGGKWYGLRDAENRIENLLSYCPLSLSLAELVLASQLP